MRLISPMLRRIFYPALGSVGYFHTRRKASVSVVTYHGVLPPQYKSLDPFLDDAMVVSSAFRSHLRLLKKHYNLIAPAQFRSWLQGSEVMPERAVLLTCDDGLLNNLTTMLPALREEGLQCLFFVTGASVKDSAGTLWYVDLYLMLMAVEGTQPPFDWQGVPIPGIPAGVADRRTVWVALMRSLSGLNPEGRSGFLRDAGRQWEIGDWTKRNLETPALRERFQLLGAAELKQLRDAGMTIGAHTMTHPILSQQPADLARAEIADCRIALEALLEGPVWALAYPFGDPASVGTREYQLAESAGYECAFLNVGGPVGAATPRFSFTRIHVTGRMSLPVYEAHISGFHDLVQRRFRGAFSP